MLIRPFHQHMQLAIIFILMSKDSVHSPVDGSGLGYGTMVITQNSLFFLKSAGIQENLSIKSVDMLISGSFSTSIKFTGMDILKYVSFTLIGTIMMF